MTAAETVATATVVRLQALRQALDLAGARDSVVIDAHQAAALADYAASLRIAAMTGRDVRAELVALDRYARRLVKLARRRLPDLI